MRFLVFFLIVSLVGCESIDQKKQKLEDQRIEINGGYFLYKAWAYEYSKKALVEDAQTALGKSLMDSVKKYSLLENLYKEKLDAIDFSIDSLKQIK